MHQIHKLIYLKNIITIHREQFKIFGIELCIN